MLTIGVVGGVASGKTQVAKCFEQIGLQRLDGDALGHEVLKRSEVKVALRARWGDQIIDAEGEIDRGSVARIVFNHGDENKQELEFLEQNTHPLIKARLLAAQELAQERNAPGVVIDAALMIKAGWDELCDHLVFVDVPASTRLQRVLERGWTEAQFEARERAQIPLALKRQKASTIIDNCGRLEETCEQVRNLWANLSSQVSSADP
ncbi:MAG: dephospho-CoA kinase [Planctomycetaceae bacterium]|nr:dephospho-CoA kinase [Planctomycetaceae bacterium]